MSYPNTPRTYRFNTNNGVIPIPNSVPGVSSGRWGDFIIDDLGNLYYYSGVAWLEVSVGGGQVFPPENEPIKLQPSANAFGAGYNITIEGGNATTAAGNGGDAELIGGNAVNGIGGNVVITSGVGSTDAGNILVTGEDGLAGGDGGSFTVDAGDGNGAGVGGNISLTSGLSTGAGNGGDVTISSGDSTTGNAGNVTITLGAGGLNSGEFRITDATEANEYFSVSANQGAISAQYNSIANVVDSQVALSGTTGRIGIGALGLQVLEVKNANVFDATSVVMITVEQIGPRAGSITVTPAAGGFAINGTGNLDETTITFFVINNAA